MTIGVLRRYSDVGGYGFVRDDEGNDTFVHVSRLNRAGILFPKQGMRLEYQVKKSGNSAKVYAANIKLLDE